MRLSLEIDNNSKLPNHTQNIEKVLCCYNSFQYRVKHGRK